MNQMRTEYLPRLYSRTSSGAINHWTIEICPTLGRYRTSYGQLEGKTTTSEWTSVVATNVGRSNERDLATQARFEAQAAWKKKKDSGCFESIEDIDQPTFIEPMLAKKWEDLEKKVSFPLFCQPKLDGMRAVISRHGAFTRNGKPWLTIPHILADLAPLFEQYPNLILDGELYCHGLHDDFNKISSLIKKTKPTAEDLIESSEIIEFWWYDTADSTRSFKQRTTFIREAYEQLNLNEMSIVMVDTHEVETKTKLDELYGKFMEEGFEGQMVRIDKPYEFKRSPTLLKRKEFQDEEYEIVGIYEGNGNKSGMAGYAVMKRADGVTFRSNIKGSHAFLKTLLPKADSLVGTFATIKYFNLTPDGIPRFPYLIRLRDGKGQD
jgi:DNA ligase-1